MKTVFFILLTSVALRVQAEIPSITYGAVSGSTTLTNPTFYPVTNRLFSFPGTPLVSTNFGGLTYYGSTFDPSNPNGNQQPVKIAFSINCKEFEVRCYGGYPDVMTYVPPDYYFDTNYINMANGEGYCLVRVQFAEKTNHNVIFYLSGSQGNYIGGVNVEQGDTIATNTLGPRKVLEVLGDSYTEGYNQDQGWCRFLGGYVMQLERMLTNVDVIPSGQGGTGFINDGPDVGETNYAGRFFANVVSNHPDFLLIQGSVNDTGLAPSNNVYYAAVTNLFALAVSNLPNCKIASVGVFYYCNNASYNPAPPTTTNYSLLTGLAATNYGLPFIDPIAGGWLNATNYMLISSDSVHPMEALYSQYAAKLYPFVTNDFGLSPAGGPSPAASATFTAEPTNGAAPLTVNFTYTGTNGNSFAWTFGDGGTSSAQNPQYSYVSNGTYSVQLTVNGSVTRTAPNLITVTNSSSGQATNTPSASATFAASPTSGAAPLTVNFAYTGTNGTSFAWTFGDGGTSGSQNPSYTYNTAGTYTVNLVVNGSVTNTASNLIIATNSSPGSSLNVASYGAVGDAVQFFVNTTSNSALVTTTNVLPVSSIGDAIEIFQVGPQTYGADISGTNAYGNQDLIATITNVVNGTNIYIAGLPQQTLLNAFATYGHNNRTNFQNAINAAGPNTTVNIPAGKFLILGGTNSTAYGYFGVVLNSGGITISGAGTNNTVLLGQGAWTIRSYYGTPYACRSFLFEEEPPIVNNLPVVLENMTLDGGVQQGNTPFHGYPANNVDGQGWDGTHDAFLVWSANSANAFNQMTWTNLVFQHWRGEMVKSIDLSTNGNLYVVNCVFNDGNATAINIYPSINFTNCLFNNLFQVAEYYQAYSTNTCYFQNNVCTNITGNEFAINGGKGSNPPFIITGNKFYLSGYGNNGIETTPADNVLISNNVFVCQNFANVIVLGCSGYQGTFDNSNIVIAANIVTNPFLFVELAGGYSATDTQRVESVTVCGNVLRNPNNAVYLLCTYGWTTNVVAYGNDCSQFLQESVNVSSGAYGAPFSMVKTNNLYFSQIAINSGATNFVSYANGSRYSVSQGITGVTALALVDTNASQIPAGAQILLVNSNTSAGTIPIYLSSSLAGSPVSVGTGQTLVANWNGAQWTTNAVAGGQPAISVTPASLPMGTILTGTSATNSFTVQNTSSSPVSGTATVAAPFSIVSGGSYSLGSNQSQTLTVVFSPTVANNYSQTVTFTGGSGASATVTGSATNAPVPSPIIQVAPGSLAYGTIPTGTSGTNSFTVQNVGTAALSGSATVAAPFSILSGGSYNLGTNQSQTVTVVFSPTVANSYSQSVTLTGGTGTNVTVAGIATNVPVSNPIMRVTPGSMAFGTLLSGASKTNHFTVKNTGSGILAGNATVAAPFSILSGGSYSLTTNQSQAVTVVFNPMAAGSYSQSVTFTGGAGTNVAVSGTATNVPTPIITVAPGSIAYGTILTGTSATNSFTVQNTGTGPLSGSATVAAPFSILSGGSYSLGTNQSQLVTVVFNPTAAGSYSQSVTLTGGAGTNVAVSGTATNIPVPIITVAPGSIAYGTILTGTSATNSFTVQNVGTGPLSGSATVAAPFSILSGGSYSLGTNQSQLVTVVFNPTAGGSYSQSLTLTGGAGTNVAVSGSATNVPYPLIAVAPGSIAFGTFMSGTSLTNNFKVQNAGSGTLTGTATVPAPFWILSGANYSLTNNQSQTVAVVFSPAVSAAYSQSVNFSGGGGTNAAVSGTSTNAAGVAPTLSAITANVTNLGANPAVLVVAPGTPVQLSASASATNSDALVWQWLESMNGATPTVYQAGTGTNPITSYTNGLSTSGCTFIWTLQVTDSQIGSSAQAQLTNFMQLLPPPGIEIQGN